MSDERFRKLLREFQTEPVTVTTVGRIYNEYLRQGEDPAPFINQVVAEVRSRVVLQGKTPALWLQITQQLGIAPETAFIIQKLMKRKGRAQILGPEYNPNNIASNDLAAMRRIAQLLGGTVESLPSSWGFQENLFENYYIKLHEDQDISETTIVYHNSRFSLESPEVYENEDQTCNNCESGDHEDCQQGIDEDGDCLCCGEPGLCTECQEGNHGGCEKGEINGVCQCCGVT